MPLAICSSGVVPDSWTGSEDPVVVAWSRAALPQASSQPGNSCKRATVTGPGSPMSCLSRSASCTQPRLVVHIYPGGHKATDAERVTVFYGRRGRPVKKPRFIPAERAHFWARGPRNGALSQGSGADPPVQFECPRGGLQPLAEIHSAWRRQDGCSRSDG
jgi:hypothetical protein